MNSILHSVWDSGMHQKQRILLELPEGDKQLSKERNLYITTWCEWVKNVCINSFKRKRYQQQRPKNPDKAHTGEPQGREREKRALKLGLFTTENNFPNSSHWEESKNAAYSWHELKYKYCM